MFDRYFALPAALARHRSAPLVKERERFLAHLEATRTGRSAIRKSAAYLLHVVNILRLRQLSEVTLEEVDRAANHWNTLRNQDKKYPAGQFGLSALLRRPGDSCASKENLNIRDCPSPSQSTWIASSRRCPSNAGSRKRPFAVGDRVPPTSSNGMGFSDPQPQSRCRDLS